MIRPIALLLMASCLGGCKPDPAPVPTDYECAPYDPRGAISTAPPDAGALMLHADLPKGSLVCGYWDGIHTPKEPLQKGHGQVAGSDPAWTPSGDALQLAVTAPPGTTVDDPTPSAGIFSTNLPFGPRTAFVAHATFQGPDISRLDPAGGAWATGAVTARTGATDDLKAEARLSATVRFNGTDAFLNVTEVGLNDSNPSRRARQGILGELKANIFEKGLPYTVGLTVNRRTGLGLATLRSGNAPPLQLPFELTIFTPVSELKITAVGAAVANCCVPGARATVLLSDFRISKPGRWPNLPIETEPNVPREPPPPIDPH